ncbi:unnamed protein product [Toxocara canis]|uniref:Secreted protein n=1 Tax=Toxocara canis TaxID=6265 RepID=A0A183UCU4_TOXCA|nr:unnamed protein product [Toxocara canis]
MLRWLTKSAGESTTASSVGATSSAVAIRATGALLRARARAHAQLYRSTRRIAVCVHFPARAISTKAMALSRWGRCRQVFTRKEESDNRSLGLVPKGGGVVQTALIGRSIRQASFCRHRICRRRRKA